jgi:CrcB protein
MPEPLLASLSIGAGAFVGANLRYGIGLLWDRLVTHPFPGDTLLINVAGSFVLAFIAGLIDRQMQVSHTVRLLVMVGFCGGFTTFSTFALETLGLLRAGSAGWALVYLLASVALSVLAAFAGFWLAGRA